MINPIEYWKSLGWYVTSPYGPRTGQYAGFHRGTDMGGKPCGHPIRFPFSGKVVAARTSGMGTWGNTVCVELDPAGEFITLNAHLQTISVKVGQRIEQGDVIGTNGGTNHSGPNYGCHIHFEVQRNDGSMPWRGTLWGDPELFYLDQAPKEPSTRFQVGNIIKNRSEASFVNVRAEPKTTSSVVDRIEPLGELQIKENPFNGHYATNFYWWFTGQGWVAESFFDLLTFPDPDPVVPPELEDTEELEEDLSSLIKLLLKKLNQFLKMLGGN
jgi:murein DD-endopeptidase MepM/ murein hydrolase activator NlpD